MDIRQQENSETTKILRPALGGKVGFCQRKSPWELPTVGAPNPYDVRVNMTGGCAIDCALGQFQETPGWIEPAALLPSHRTGWF